ncbi:MAG: transglycosylase SLT domain-containing protein [Ardenticatenaceae bacterium]|nr:transglycosylase SLT domain-containing protein [Ardenticatenaceae bacterium]MCB9444909.1 transglycosylase SLT domain-containing protein [Ardenticatenaceae bacterium]
MLKAKWDADKRRFLQAVAGVPTEPPPAPVPVQLRFSIRVHLRYLRPVLFLLAVLLLAACANDPIPPTPLAQEPTATMPPTPTLIPGLPTDPPPPTIAPSPTFTPIPTPTATPPPATRIALGEAALAEGNLETAADQLATGLSEAEALTEPQQIAALLSLGKAYLDDGRFPEAATTFTQLLDTGQAPTETGFLLAQALEGAGDNEGAIAAYQAYLDANPEMAAYVQPRIAAAYLALGDTAQAIAAYEAALTGPAHRLTIINIHQQLADLYLADENYAAAIDHYNAIHDLAETEFTRGQMTYLAGLAELQIGDVAAAQADFAKGVAEYPRAYESYLGLVQLVDAGVPVDEFQRALVDFYADAYDPAVAAFQRYLADNPEDFRADAYLYLAWSYEALGDLEAALAQLDAYAASEPVGALIERAKMMARVGDGETAIANYLAYLETYPDGPDAPFANWRAAQLTEQAGDSAAAISLYQSLANNYSWHEDAPEALFRAGFLADEMGDEGTAVTLWQQTIQNYPQTEYGSAALVWLLKTGPVTTTIPISPTTTLSATTTTITPTNPLSLALALAENRVDYYPLRALDVAAGAAPFPPVAELQLGMVDADRAQAETWLRDLLALEPETDIAELSPILTEDERFIIGEKLWRAGLLEAAKRELESLRADVADDALLSYQLALFFREIGLYRSSILAATSVLNLTNQTVFTAPPFIGRLAYPVYYADLILPLAEQYGYDPLLQFALVRQESLFESFARSGAAAQGLAQVIPDTGAYIAQRLAWPDFVNEDLYKPYVGLAFGAYYLDQQLRAFDGFTAAALSAYNAGPGNAAIWYEQAGADHDLYLETVNFAETRLYIERIYTGYVVYRFLYGG